MAAATAKGIRAGRAYVEMGVDKSGLARGLRAAERRLKRFGASVRALGQRMAALGAVASLPFIASAKVFAAFADKMAVVRAVTGATEGQFAALSEEAKRLGRTTSFTASQVAGAMIELGRAGFKPRSILDATAAVLNLARATDTELPRAAELGAAALRGFQLDTTDAGRVADVLAAGANASAQTLEDMGEALKFVAPLAVEAGASIEETAAATGVLANNGLKGTVAGTALARAYKNLSTTAAHKKLQAIGVEAVNSAGDLRPLATILAELGRATQNFGSAKKLALFETLFGRGSAAALKLAGAGAVFDDLQQTLNNAGGTAARVAQQMDDNLGGSFRKLLSAVEGVAIAVGEAVEGAFRKFVDIATQISGSVTAFIKANRGLVVGTALAAAGIAAVGVTLIGLGLSVTLAGVALGGLATVLSTIGALFGALVSPVGAALAAIAGLAVGLAHFTEVGNTVVTFLGRRFQALKDVALAAFGGIADALAAGDIVLAADIMWKGLKLLWLKGTEGIRTAWYKAMSGMQRLAIDVVAGVQVLWVQASTRFEQVWNTAIAAVSRTWQRFVSLLASTWLKVQTFFTNSLARIKGLFDSSFDAKSAIAANTKALRQQESVLQRELDANLDKSQRKQTAASAAIADERRKAMDAIGSALNIAQEDRQRQFDDRLSAAQRELEDAQREFRSARARAAQLRGDESGALAEEIPAELQKAAHRIADGISDAASLTGKATARGTFNPAALLGLQGGGSVEEKQLRELELLNKTSKETKAEIRKAKPVFT